MTFEHLLAPGRLETARRGAAGEPASKIQVVHFEGGFAQRLPGLRVDGAVDVVVAGDDEKAVALEVQAVEQRGEELVCFGEFLAPAPVGGIAGEAHEIDGIVLDESGEILLPGRAEHPPSPLALGLASGAGVQVRQVEQA